MKTPQPLVVDTERRTVKIGDKDIYVAPKEFAILAMLAEAEGRVVSREKLLDAIWDDAGDEYIDSRTVDQHVARLRRKIGWDYIITVTSAGYKAVGVQINTVTSVWGKVSKIERSFGSRPGAYVTVKVNGSALERLSEGHRVRVV